MIINNTAYSLILQLMHTAVCFFLVWCVVCGVWCVVCWCFRVVWPYKLMKLLEYEYLYRVSSVPVAVSC